MESGFRKYRERRVKYAGVKRINDWTIKVYTITTSELFKSNEVLVNVMDNLPGKLSYAKDHHSTGFLIVHEGTDGVWSLINWWTGGEMLKTTTYFTSFEDQQTMTLCPNEGSMACVWELPIINHEKNAWIKHVLKKASKPDFGNYFTDTIEGKV